MKLSSLRSLAASLVALLCTSSLAQAHPGHSAFDWTVAPHGGHTSEHVFLLVVLALAALGCVGHWMATRNR